MSTSFPSNKGGIAAFPSQASCIPYGYPGSMEQANQDIFKNAAMKHPSEGNDDKNMKLMQYPPHIRPNYPMGKVPPMSISDQPNFPGMMLHHQHQHQMPQAPYGSIDFMKPANQPTPINMQDFDESNHNMQNSIVSPQTNRNRTPLAHQGSMGNNLPLNNLCHAPSNINKQTNQIYRNNISNVSNREFGVMDNHSFEHNDLEPPKHDSPFTSVTHFDMPPAFQNLRETFKKINPMVEHYYTRVKQKLLIPYPVGTKQAAPIEPSTFGFLKENIYYQERFDRNPIRIPSQMSNRSPMNKSQDLPKNIRQYDRNMGNNLLKKPMYEGNMMGNKCKTPSENDYKPVKPNEVPMGSEQRFDNYQVPMGHDRMNQNINFNSNNNYCNAICSQCHQEIPGDVPAMICKYKDCDKKYHKECTGLIPQAYMRLEQESHFAKWVCPKCSIHVQGIQTVMGLNG